MFAGALPVFRAAKDAQNIKAAMQVTGEAIDAFYGLLLDGAILLITDSDVFIPNAEAGNIFEEHSVNGPHDHENWTVTVCVGKDCITPEARPVCISN